MMDSDTSTPNSAVCEPAPKPRRATGKKRASPGQRPLDKRQRLNLRRALEDQRDIRRRQLVELQSQAGLDDDEPIMVQLASLRRVIGEIEAALGRVDDGTYGLCRNCWRTIPAGRLEILPHVRYCVACQQRADDGRAVTW